MMEKTSYLSKLTAIAERVSDIYSETHSINRDRTWYLMKVTEELGELNQAYMRQCGQGRTKGKSPDELRQDMADEAADVLAQLLLFMSHENINPDDALRRKWFKYLPDEEAKQAEITLTSY